MLDTTDRTPEQMADELRGQFPLSPDAPYAIAVSHRDEAIRRQKHAAVDFWARVADVLASEPVDA